jgi:hypothetical protein
MTDRESGQSLGEQAKQFAAALTETLQATLPGAPEAIAEMAEQAGRVVVRPGGDVPLHLNTRVLARLDVRLRCQLDSSGTWLAIESSSFSLVASLDRAPVIRFDYLREPTTAPAAHVQVHAHRGALTHLLSQAGHPKPHDIGALHIPVGGARFRPCLEDVLQFLITDCRFDGHPNWQQAVLAGRERWRRVQARAVTRDFPAEAVETLIALGYEVTPPSGGHPPSPEKALRGW